MGRKGYKKRDYARKLWNENSNAEIVYKRWAESISHK
jgi:hypothetical protein